MFPLLLPYDATQATDLLLDLKKGAYLPFLPEDADKSVQHSYFLLQENVRRQIQRLETLMDIWTSETGAFIPGRLEESYIADAMAFNRDCTILNELINNTTDLLYSPKDYDDMHRPY